MKSFWIKVFVPMILFPLSAKASDLNEVSLFYRCFSHITKQRPATNHPLLSEVKNGNKSAVSACMEILAKANFVANGNTRVNDINDSITLATLHNFHSFHSSWFSKRDLSVTADICVDSATNDLYDATTPALYVTRALFDANSQYRSIVSGQTGLAPIRTNDTPGIGPQTGRTWGFRYLDINGSPQNWNVNFAQTGDLLGVQPSLPTLAPLLTTFFEYSGTTRENLNLDIFKSHGAGILGHQTYLLANIAEQPDFRYPQRYSSDGGVKVARRWSKAVFKDILCRELPVVRLSDSKPFVRPNSSIGFRKSNSCTQCHASMDRMANTVRGIRYASTHTCSYYSNQHAGAFFTYRKPASLPAADKWPSEPDPDFFKRPSDGTLYYRSYNGSLVNRNYTGLEALGQALSQEDDMYVCAAKRYFYFFTGIEVDTGDIEDPLSPVKLNEQEVKMRDFVVNLGKDLKQHQDPQQLIKDIISSSIYRTRDYGLGGSNE